MTLMKVIRVRNVARLTSLTATGDVQFRRLTLIYGDNGSGKTSLSAILRSAATNNAAFIQERATLGAPEPTEVSLLTTSGEIRYTGGAWTGTIPRLEVFDDTFVRENVFAGDAVDKEQRRNLYQVVVGPAAVALARRVDALDSESRSTARSITETERQLRDLIQAPFALEEFLGLPRVQDSTERIAAHTRELNALRNAAAILNRSQLARVSLPPAPRTQVLSLLNVTFGTIAEDASRVVRQHIASLDERGEAWLRQGLSYAQQHICPFCAQDTNGVPLIEMYQAFFSSAYEAHVVQIQRALNEVDQTFSADRMAALDRLAIENAGHIQLWSDLTDLSSAQLDVTRLQAIWLHLHSTLVEALRRKLANPGGTSHDLPAVEAALQDYEGLSTALAALNSAIDLANRTIADVKRDAARGDESRLEQELRRLRNSQIRHEPEANRLCEQLVAQQRSKRDIETEKARTREELVTQAEVILSGYEGDINRLLKAFGASFTLRGTTPTFAGGRASSTYQITVNGVPVDIGDSETPAGIPCFRTVLSAGDKSALALAFFLAKLSRDPHLADTTVVLDDPLTSLDSFRTAYTQQSIARLAGQAKQVVVLSHEPFFLKGIADVYEGDLKTLRLRRTSGTFTLREWDVREHCLAEAQKDFFILRRFLDDGVPEGAEALTVARAIRPYVEGYLRHRFPDQLFGTGMLGDFISKVRAAGTGTDLAVLQPKVDDLEDINMFSRRVHHGGDGGPPVIVSEEEVRSYADRALAFVRT